MLDRAVQPQKNQDSFKKFQFMQRHGYQFMDRFGVLDLNGIWTGLRFGLFCSFSLQRSLSIFAFPWGVSQAIAIFVDQLPRWAHLYFIEVKLHDLITSLG